MMKRSASHSGSWAIGELAKATGVSTDTLRHYERKGVLSDGWESITVRDLKLAIAALQMNEDQ